MYIVVASTVTVAMDYVLNRTGKILQAAEQESGVSEMSLMQHAAEIIIN